MNLGRGLAPVAEAPLRAEVAVFRGCPVVWLAEHAGAAAGHRHRPSEKKRISGLGRLGLGGRRA